MEVTPLDPNPAMRTKLLNQLAEPYQDLILGPS